MGSHPQIVGSDGVSSCWRSLRNALGASVWDYYFNSEGTPTGGTGVDPPVTTNKARGPLSGQAKKIGLHAYYLIDHIFFNDAFKLERHAYRPQQFSSAASALEVVVPALEVPSDHYPVVVDLTWR